MMSRRRDLVAKRRVRLALEPAGFTAKRLYIIAQGFNPGLACRKRRPKTGVRSGARRARALIQPSAPASGASDISVAVIHYQPKRSLAAKRNELPMQNL